MALIRWEPFRDIEQFLSEAWPPAASGFGWDLAVDVYEEKDKVIATMNVPGIDPDKVAVSFNDEQHLRIAGARQEQRTEEKNYYSREIRHGSFERLVRLPTPVDQNKAEATYESGVLKITAPKKKESVVDKVKIKVSRK